MKIPLAWHQLFHERMRLLAAIAGIAFADVLIFMQLGFKNALFDSAISIPKSLQGDVFILSNQTDTFVSTTPFSARRLYQVMGKDEVEKISNLYIGVALWKNPETRDTRQVYVMAFNPVFNPIDLEGVSENLDIIKRPDMFMFDQKSRPEFGPIKDWFLEGKTVKTEVGNRKIEIGGLFSLGSSFGADGTIISSDLNFFRLYPDRSKGLIDVGVIQLKPGVDASKMAASLREELSAGDVQVFTKEELINYELNYWQNATNIGFIFGLGTAMGFVVGIVIVYQILYTDVSNHLPEYATLKAIGYGDRYLLGIVFQEALLLAIIGFLPSLGLGIFLYSNTARSTGLPLIMTVARAGNVLIMTILMCCISGAIAVSRLRAADPADIF